MNSTEKKAQRRRSIDRGFATLTGLIKPAVQATEIYCTLCGAVLLKGSPGAPRYRSLCGACKTEQFPRAQRVTP